MNKKILDILKKINEYEDDGCELLFILIAIACFIGMFAMLE